MPEADTARSCFGTGRSRGSPPAPAPSTVTISSSTNSRPWARTPQRRPQLLFETRGDRVTAAGQRPDDEALPRFEILDDTAGHMPETPSHSVSLHGVADGLRYHQADLGVTGFRAGRAQRVHDEIGLSGSNSTIDRQSEVGRPCHPVPGRKQRSKSCVGSRSQRTTALAASRGHDGTPGTGAHPQPETMHACTTAVVRLKRPLTLGHGCHSSFVWRTRTITSVVMVHAAC